MFIIKPDYQTFNQIHTHPCEIAKKLRKILLVVSFSYAFFNLPYLISWSIFFFEISFNELTASNQNYLFSAVQLSEIF